MRRKLGVSYAEILVAIAIFSVGVVPLLFSLNSSFEATVYNEKFTQSMEYNRQIMEEIGSYLPTKVNNYSDLDKLYDDIKKICIKRSEKNATPKGIYKRPDWDGSSFIFVKNKMIDSSLYRVVKVGSMKKETDEDTGKKSGVFDVTVESYLSRNEELISRNVMRITLADERVNN